MLRKYFMLFLLLSGLSATAQQYNYKKYTVADGLPSNLVYDVKQDAEGFIWVATDAGVARFDGRKFTVFTQQDGLVNNDVIMLYPDSKGRLWMVSMHNSMCYYYKGRFYNYRNDTSLQKMRPLSSFLLVVENDAGDMAFASHEHLSPTIYILTADNQVKYDQFNHKIRGHTSLAAGVRPHEFLYSIYDSSAHKSDFHLYNGEKWQPWYSVKWSTTSDYYQPYKMINGKMEQQPPVYYPNSSKMMLAQISDFDNIKFSFRPSEMIKVSCNINKGRTIQFFSTHHGIYMVDTKTEKINDHLVPDLNTNRASMDKEGNIWIATQSDGLLMIPTRNVRSYTYPNNSTDILSIYKAGNQIYTGNSDGKLYIIKNGEITSKDFSGYHAIANNKGLVNWMRFIEPLEKDWLGLGFDNFLISYDVITGKSKFNKTDVNKAIAPAGKDSFLVATGRGTLLVDKELNILDTIWRYRSYSCLKSGNDYYIGTPNGPVKITPGRQPFIMANAIPELQALVTRMCKDPSGDLWIATSGNGLFKLRNDTVVVQFNSTNGLASNNCKSIFPDAKFLWVGTEKGLQRINWRNLSEPLQLYTTEDGLPSNDILSIFSDSGKLYVGSSGKLTLFDTTLIRQSTFCKLIMLNVEAGGKAVNNDSLHLLKYDENSLRFNFTGISFRSSDNISYHYKLNGYSDTWSSTSNTSLEFIALPPGNYDLKVFARNKFGVQSDTISVPFKISPPFWKTWWFRILIVGITAALVWWLIIRRIRQEQAKSATQNRINELEQLALRSQMNPHFIFNCLNSIQNFLLQNNFEKTNEYLTSFAHLIRQTLDNSSRSSISIESECRYLSSYLELESMRFSHSFVYDIEVDPAIDADNTFIPTMILQPYVENSIRHGLRYRLDGLKSVRVLFRKRGNTLVCIVEDNGIGRKKASELKSFMHVEYQSKGMTLTAERIAALNRRQEIPITVDVIDLEEDGNATGTQVIVRFPNVFL
ncbi:sensor histidine kinase [Pseudoflavitalea rhizosphaerae]|uniref:sensor histidine kinase n=1 Tax=Pseudoflavitalea rhizosphaerae TaxID=1884793 RepID=UPI000F8DF156|nr:sensor histidine kinase [Pseudoflavitalea rhizosphaerae]